MTEARNIANLVEWAEATVILEDGKPIRLESHQKRILNRAFEFDTEGKLRYSTIVYSCPKKSGKTTVGAIVALWMAYEVEPKGEVICCANDEEQSVGRTFKMARQMIERSPVLMDRIKQITRTEITLKDGGIIKAVPSDFAGEAGANPTCTIWTELWGYTSERSRRLFEELTPVPTRRNSIRFIETYAGHQGESELLESIYKRAMAGKRIWKTSPCYEAGTMFAYWDHEPRMPWQTPEYYEQQKEDLRPLAYLRLHENRWVSSESAFINMNDWESCVDPNHGPILARGPRNLHITVGVDASIKHDSTAVVAVTKYGDEIVLVQHSKWQPSKREPMDLERTVEAQIRELAKIFHSIRVFYDPFQFHRSATTLRRAGIKMIEFPQTQDRLTQASQNLYELIKWRRLKVYPDADLTEHIKNAVAKETARGFRIVKEKASKKIDLAIALAMASLMAHKSPVKRGGTWGSEYLRDRKRPPLSQIANAGLVIAAKERERTRKRKPLDSFTDAVLSGRARIIRSK